MRKPTATPQASQPGSAPRGAAGYGTPAQIVTAVATTLILVVALVGLIAFWPRPAAEAETTAAAETPRQIFHTYLDLALRAPALAVPDYNAIKANPRDRALYEPLVAQLLLSCEAILGTFAEDEDDEAWRALCGKQIAHHARYLCDTLNEDALGLYDSESFRGFLVETLTAARGPAAECTTAKLDEIKKAVEGMKEAG